MNDVVKFGDSSVSSMMKLSETLAKSSLIPSALRGKPSDILLIFMMANELGIAPIQAMNGINVIQGKPCISPQLMVALIHSKIATAIISIDDSKDGVVTCTMARNDKTPGYTSTWDMDRAKALGLTAKDNWKKQPQTMLKWRAIGDAARTVFPDVIMGLYLPEEMESVPEEDKPEPVQVKSEIVEPEKKQHPVTNEPDAASKEIFAMLAKLTNNYQDKKRLNLIMEELNIKGSKDILVLDESSKMDVLSYLRGLNG